MQDSGLSIAPPWAECVSGGAFNREKLDLDRVSADNPMQCIAQWEKFRDMAGQYQRCTYIQQIRTRLPMQE